MDGVRRTGSDQVPRDLVFISFTSFLIENHPFLYFFPKSNPFAIFNIDSVLFKILLPLIG